MADWLAPDVYWLMPDTRLEPPDRMRPPLEVIWYSPLESWALPSASFFEASATVWNCVPVVLKPM